MKIALRKWDLYARFIERVVDENEDHAAYDEHIGYRRWSEERLDEFVESKAKNGGG